MIKTAVPAMIDNTTGKAVEPEREAQVSSKAAENSKLNIAGEKLERFTRKSLVSVFLDNIGSKPL